MLSVTASLSTLNSLLSSLDDLDPVACAIRQHEQACAMQTATRDRHFALQEAFDPELELEEDSVIEAAVVAHFGEQAPAELARYRAAVSASEKASEFEEAATAQLENVEIRTALQLAAWQEYILCFARDVEDQCVYVTLSRALEKVCAMQAEHMAA